MKVCFLGNSKSYKTSVATYIWSGLLTYHKPTIEYQLFSHKEHVIYDCGCSRYYMSKCIPYEEIDFFIIFVNPIYQMLDISVETIYNTIRTRNKNARIMGVIAPTSLTECIEVGEEIKIYMNTHS